LAAAAAAARANVQYKQTDIQTAEEATRYEALGLLHNATSAACSQICLASWLLYTILLLREGRRPWEAEKGERAISKQSSMKKEKLSPLYAPISDNAITGITAITGPSSS
jgi:hypothetical protein